MVKYPKHIKGPCHGIPKQVIWTLFPIVYVTSPHTVPPRDEMMNFDPVTGAGQPKCKEIDQVWGVLPLLREICWDSLRGAVHRNFIY